MLEKSFPWPQEAEQDGFLSLAPPLGWQLPYAGTNIPQTWLNRAAVNVNTEKGSCAYYSVILPCWCYVRNVP